jgi:nucleoid-associated protein YgaU
LLVAAAGGAARAAGNDAASAPHVRTSRIYVIKPGDTLWSIAVRLVGPEADPRPLVEVLAATNHTDGALVPGQTLEIPSA